MVLNIYWYTKIVVNIVKVTKNRSQNIRWLNFLPSSYRLEGFVLTFDLHVLYPHPFLSFFQFSLIEKFYGLFLASLYSLVFFLVFLAILFFLTNNAINIKIFLLVYCFNFKQYIYEIITTKSSSVINEQQTDTFFMLIVSKLKNIAIIIHGVYETWCANNLITQSYFCKVC